ncbi:MAG: chemotaxis protein CheW [Treponema sp.]|nr:chemotaxis protein CheW [Treponema sp.]
MRGLSFIVNNEYFTVDIELVQQVMRKMTITPVPSAPDNVTGITNLKGRVITILNLCVLLGHKKKSTLSRAEEYNSNEANAIIFKALSDSDYQLGLLIDKPGNLVEIDDNTIRPPSLPSGAEESFCICGIAEMNNRLFRIINVDSIINKYKYNGGNENAENN